MNFRFLSGTAFAFALAAAAVLVPPASLAATGEGSAHGGRLPSSDLAGGWREAKKADVKAEAKKAEAKKAEPSESKGDAKAKGKPVQIGSFGDWGAFLALGAKDKTCYALAKPKDRAPASLKRDPAYVFISNRPAEKVRNEVSIIMGFAMKDGAEAHAAVAGSDFDLIAKGSNAWIKNPAEETQFIDTLKKGSKLVVKAASLKGNVTTDTYSLSGISQALEKIQKECQ